MSIFSLKRGLAAVMTAALLLLAPALASAQDEAGKAQAQAQLKKAMAGESPLTDKDVKIYMANLDAILSLHANTATMDDVVKKMGWTSNRFAYVSTKMSVGMTMLLKPDNPNLKNVPDFARPSKDELELIKKNQDDLVKAMEAVQKKGAGK